MASCVAYSKARKLVHVPDALVKPRASALPRRTCDHCETLLPMSGELLDRHAELGHLARVTPDTDGVGPRAELTLFVPLEACALARHDQICDEMTVVRKMEREVPAGDELASMAPITDEEDTVATTTGRDDRLPVRVREAVTLNVDVGTDCSTVRRRGRVRQSLWIGAKRRR